MNYETAKKLKDAGFPQTGLGKWFMVGYEVAQVLVTHFPSEDKLLAYSPTLSELIEACGRNFAELENTFDGWRVYAHDFVNVEYTYWAKTPEEAVANLWLALNKK